MALEVFEHIYGNMTLKENNYQDVGKLYAIDITSSNNPDAYFSNIQYLYVPDACFNNSCRFHVDFHGCTLSNIRMGDYFMRKSGYLEHAAANDIILLFPSNNDTEWGHCWRSSV